MAKLVLEVPPADKGGTKAWSGVPPRGMEYWRLLDDVIQREPLEPRDILFHAMLRPLGPLSNWPRA